MSVLVQGMQQGITTNNRNDDDDDDTLFEQPNN